MDMWKEHPKSQKMVSRAVVRTVQKNKSIKIALDSRKLNELTKKRKAQMSNMEDLISRTARKRSEEEDSEILATKLNFDYAYEQIQLDKKTRNLGILNRWRIQ